MKNQQQQYKAIYLSGNKEIWKTINAVSFDDCYRQFKKQHPTEQLHTISPVDYFNLLGR